MGALYKSGDKATAEGAGQQQQIQTKSPTTPQGLSRLYHQIIRPTGNRSLPIRQIVVIAP